MIRVRKKRYVLRIYLGFILCMTVIVAAFVIRVIQGSNVTPLSVGQLRLSSKEYEFGTVLDRNGEMIVSGNSEGLNWTSPEAKAAFDPILGIDIEATSASRTTVLANCPWVFGAEDNRFTWKHLLQPNRRKAGGSVRLTIDEKLQEYVASLVADLGYKNAYVCVSNYATGEILAIYGDIFGDTLAPGSTLKPILVAAALSLEPELIGYTYNCIPENHVFWTKDGEKRINCAYNSSHGRVGITDAMAYSCNGFFISIMKELAKRAGKENVLNILAEWGFDTTVSYSQFIYWDHSYIKGSEKEIDYLLAAIGQSNAQITPAALNICTNALLNHGKLAEPIWFSEKQAYPEGDWEPVERADLKEICSAEVADQVVAMMEEVTTRGTGTAFNIPEYAFPAKTGTAEKLDGSYTVWTTGGLTGEETPYSVTVALDSVTEEESGADAGRIARNILLYMTEGDL